MKMNSDEIYENGEYLKKNPTWDAEHSPAKAANIFKILQENNISLKTLAEIGCGAGEIINQLHAKMDKVDFVGYEISEQAFELSKTRTKERLNYKLEDLVAEDNKDFFDVLVVADIFEHVENYLPFIRECKKKATYKVFHIPLDMNVQMVMRATPFMYVRAKVGHLHYFSKETALATLKDAGHEIVDYFYTSHEGLAGRSFKSKILNIPRRIFYNISKDLTARFLGGYSLMVLTK